MPKSKFVIPEPKMDQKITFSFEFYDVVRCIYCISKWDQKQIFDTLKRLKDISQKSSKELFISSRVLHFHSVDWKDTIEKNGFPESKANELDAFQFSLVGVNNQKARVYGAFARGVFYIVWFDLDHKIWPSFKKHT